MLRFWNKDTHNGYQINQDDVDQSTFYITPKQPTIGRTGDGDSKLAFIFRKYRYADGAAQKTKGGGYLVFDASLEVPQADQDAIKAYLQKKYEAATPDKPIDGVKQNTDIKLASIPFTEGSVTLNIGKDESNFVQTITTLGKPSSDGRYTASFSAALSPDGATYFEKAMSDKGGGAVQVLYTLKTFFRSGDTVVKGSFHKQSALDYLETHKVEHKMWRESEDHRDITSQLNTAKAVQVDAVWGNETAEEKLQIRTWVTSAVNDAIKNQLPDLAQPQQSDADANDVSVKLKESTIEDFTIVFHEQVAMQIELNPQGMLPNPSAIIDPSTGKPYVWTDYFEEVDLDDPWFKSLNLGVSNQAAFDNSPLTGLTVDLWYTNGDKEHAKTYSFSKDNNARQLWSPFGTNDKYQYRYTAYFDGGPSYTSERMEGTSQELVIGGEVGGMVQVDAIATGLNFDLIKNVAVTVQVVDPTTLAKGPCQTVFLDEKTPLAKAALLVGNKFVPPYAYEYTLEYLLPDGVRIRQPAKSGSGRQLLVLPCFEATRTINISARLGEGDTALVTLDYVEDGGYRRHTSLLLDADNKQRQWKLGVVDGEVGRLSYSVKFDLASGEALEMSTRQASSDSISLDPANAAPSGEAGVLEVTVDPTGIDWDGQGVYNVMLTLAYAGKRSDLSFTSADHTTTKKVRWERKPDAQEYTWKAVYICKRDKKTLRIASTMQSSGDAYMLVPSPDEVDVEKTPAAV